MKGSFRLLSLAVLAVALQFAHPALAATDATSDSKTIMFVCLHGAAHSWVAAGHFNKMAGERALPLHGDIARYRRRHIDPHADQGRLEPGRA